MSDPVRPSTDGHRALAISNGLTRLHHEYYGRGANTARTIIAGNFVITFLEDVYTRIERTLIDSGEHDSVRETRLAFQRAMEEKFTNVVEEVMGRKVIAFLSQVHFNPDLSQETFVLEPQAGDAAPEDGA
jgi:uncharacterized protein YbcI